MTEATAASNEKTGVKFIKAYPGYNLEETAAFPADVAAEMFKSGIAVPQKLEKPRDRSKDVGWRPKPNENLKK